MILDIMLPRVDGLEVCRHLRAESTVPIIMLTARDDETDRIIGLELGADDYVTKPFSPRELVARVRAVLPTADTDERPARTLAVVVRDEPEGGRDTGAGRDSLCGRGDKRLESVKLPQKQRETSERPG